MARTRRRMPTAKDLADAERDNERLAVKRQTRRQRDALDDVTRDALDGANSATYDVAIGARGRVSGAPSTPREDALTPRELVTRDIPIRYLARERTRRSQGIESDPLVASQSSSRDANEPSRNRIPVYLVAGRVGTLDTLRKWIASHRMSVRTLVGWEDLITGDFQSLRKFRDALNYVGAPICRTHKVKMVRINAKQLKCPANPNCFRRVVPSGARDK